MFEDSEPDDDNRYRLEKSGTLIEFSHGMDPRARRYARQFADRLDVAELWRPEFEVGVSQIAQLMIEIGDLQISIRQNGLTHTTEKNQTARNVEVSTLNQCRSQLAGLLAKFRMTPSTVEQPKEDSGSSVLAKLAAKRGITVPGMKGHV